MSRQQLILRLALPTALALFGAVACGGSSSGGGGGGGGGNGGSAGAFTFGTSADPITMDGAYVSDGESLRVIGLIFDTLVKMKPGSTDVVPGLATSWNSSDSQNWTFHIRSNVTFTDGTAADATAVCANFDRWYNFKGLQQSPSVSYYWSTVFGGFATHDNPDVPQTSLYKSCDASDPTTAVIHLTSPSASFLAGLALPAFSIGSPTAMKKYNADQVSGSADSPKFTGSYGTQHPTGSGPFKLQSYTPGDQLALVPNPNYWGTKPTLSKLILKPIADATARRQALESGEIQGYDDADPGDINALKGEGDQILYRPAFNVGYVGINQAKAPLDNIKVRQAIAYALNRQALVTAKYGPGSVVAKEFMPPNLFGYNPNVTTYNYDPAKAKQLLAASGNPHPSIDFWYPTAVSRPYMPDPAANFQAFKSDLEAVGFKVTAKSAPWNPDYISKVDAGAAGIYLLGWTGDFGDPDDFIGVFFGSKQLAWGFNNPKIFNELKAAKQETDQTKRTQMYEQANADIMTFLPGVPYVHTSAALVFAPGWKGFTPSPVGPPADTFATLTKG
jgi:peptide/nickel transport system substrate-binding protein